MKNKNMKKLASLVLALAMVLSMVTTVWAEGSNEPTYPGSITVNNAQGDYVAYKIFDVVYNTPTDSETPAYAYTITDTSEWYTTVSGYANESNNGLTLTASAANQNVYIVETTTDFSAAAFAKYLKEKIKGLTLVGGETLIKNGTIASASNLELGYYFVTSTLGALCNLTTTNPSVIIHDKNDHKFEKTVDDSSVEIGQVLTFTINGKVPDTTGFTTYTYQVSDTMSTGLTFGGVNSVNVKVDNAKLDSSKWHVVQPEDTNGFVLNITVTDETLQRDKVGKDIIVTYTATVNENAIATVEENKAVLEYSKDPTSSELGREERIKKVYSAQIVIDKYEAKDGTDDKSVKLANAKFVLYKMEGSVKKYYKYDEATKKVSWVDGITSATEVTTNGNGSANFNGLKDGQYCLHETAAPAGYNLLKDDVTVTIDGSQSIAEQSPNTAVLSQKAEVANTKGQLLPSTGGIGTTIFYVAGAVLVLSALVLLITKKRMNLTK